MKPNSYSKKARKSSRYYNAHRNASPMRRYSHKPSVQQKLTVMQRLRAMFRRREPETKTGTTTE